MDYADYSQVIVAKIELVKDLLSDIDFRGLTVEQAVDVRTAAFDRAYRAVSQTVDEVEDFGEDEEEEE